MVDTAFNSTGADALRWRLWYLFLVVFLSLAESRVIFLVYDNIHQHAEALYGIVVGQPHWKEYQNRLLGAYLVKYAATFFSLPYEVAYVFFLIGLGAIKNLLFYSVVLRLTQSFRHSLQYTLCFVFFFIALQNAAWLYLWDYFDIIVFTLFTYGVLTAKRDWYYLPIFALALLNKESCLFIAVWLILDALINKPETARLKLNLGALNPSRLLTGISLAVIGVIFVIYTRQALLIQETAVAANPAFALERPFHFQRNILTYVGVWLHPSLNFDFAVNILVTLLPLTPLFLWRRMDDTVFKLTLLILVFYLSVLAFGLIHETRLYSLLIPIYCLLYIHLYHPRDAAHSPAAESSA